MPIFNQLSYARRPNMYVSPPIGALKETMDVLEHKYLQNKAAADKLQVAAENMKILEEDQWIKDAAVEQVRAEFDHINELGNWEDASLRVADVAKNFATNQALNTAASAYQQKQAELANLEERVGKPFEEGGITREDYIYEAARADASYTGVQQDPETGRWEGQYTVNTPPAYLDRGTYIDEFLTDYASNKRLGNLIKGEDGKWYRQKYTTTPDGSHHLAELTEEATYDEVYKAAREHMMQNQHIKNRVQYEADRNNLGYEEYASAGINDKAMRTALKELGHEKGKIDAMSNDELADAYTKEMVVNSSIEGAVSKHAFKKESVQVLGRTWDSLQAEIRLRNANRKGGDDMTVVNNMTIAQYLTQGYSVTNIPKSIGDYERNLKTFEREIQRHGTTISHLREQLNDPNLSEDDKEVKKAELYNAIVQQQEYERQRDEYAYWLDQAVMEVYKGKGTSNKVVAKYLKTKDEVTKAESSPILTRIDRLVPNKTIGTLAGGGGTEYGAGRGVVDIPIDKTYRQYQEQVENLHKDGRISDADYKFYKDYVKKSNDLRQQNRDLAYNKVDTMRSINEVMSRNAEDKTVSYAYVDLATDDFGKETAFAKGVTQKFRRNFDKNYRVLETDGTPVAFNDLDEDDKVNIMNTEIVGMTTQYVGEHGYLLVANEKMFDADGNPLPGRIHLIKPLTNDGSMQLAVTELRKGTRFIQDQLKPGYDITNLNEIEQIWHSTDIDRQMSTFDNHPIVTPFDLGKDTQYETVTKKVNVGPEYTANVTRLVDNSGNINWQVSLTDRVTGKTHMETYADYYEAEYALEHAAGSGYEVPLSSLEKVSDRSLRFGTVKGTIASPYLTNDMLSELRDWEAEAQIPYTVTSLTRSKIDNELANGAETSGHLYGNGVDMRVTSELRSWLRKNSAKIEGSNYKQILGTNLRWLIHDAGSGEHIDMKLITVDNELYQDVSTYTLGGG